MGFPYPVLEGNNDVQVWEERCTRTVYSVYRTPYTYGKSLRTKRVVNIDTYTWFKSISPFFKSPQPYNNTEESRYVCLSRFNNEISLRRALISASMSKSRRFKNEIYSIAVPKMGMSFFGYIPQDKCI